MSVGRADTGGGLKGPLRAVIIMAAIVLVVLVMAPMARAAQSPTRSESPMDPAAAQSPMYERSASDLPANRSVRPDKGSCFTTYRGDTRSPIATSVTVWSDRSGESAGAEGAGDEYAAYRPCGRPAPFAPYGLGSLIWRGPDWGDPTLGHRT